MDAGKLSGGARVLTNPAYAGAFVFGRTTQRREFNEEGRVRRRTVQLPIEEWSVCLPEHHPGYVSWQEYLATRERLRQNVRPRGEGGGAAREGLALLQGIVRCGRCGRRMQVAYSGRAGRSPTYACVRAFTTTAPSTRASHSAASGWMTRSPRRFLRRSPQPGCPCAPRRSANSSANTKSACRASGWRSSAHSSRPAAAERQFDACEPENRLVARTLERAWEQALSRLESERRKLAKLEAQRPEPLTPPERRALARLARDLPRLWRADTTTARDRKELLRTLVCEVIVTVKDDPRRAEIEIVWEGGTRTELQVPLIRRGGERHRTSEDTVDLIRRLAAHTDDQQIAAILNKQGRRTGTGLPFSQSRVKYVRQQHQIPAAPPPDPDNGLVTIHQAARELGVSNATVYRWLSAGLLPGEQTTPHAPWRIRLTNESRTRFVPAVPDGYVPLDEAAKRFGCARQTVLHKVQRGELDAVQVINGRRKGLRIKVTGPDAGLFEK